MEIEVSPEKESVVIFSAVSLKTLTLRPVGSLCTIEKSYLLSDYYVVEPGMFNEYRGVCAVFIYTCKSHTACAHTPTQGVVWCKYMNEMNEEKWLLFSQTSGCILECVP